MPAPTPHIRRIYYTNLGLCASTFQQLKTLIATRFTHPMHILVSDRWEYKSMIVNARDHNVYDLSDEGLDWSRIVLFNFSYNEIQQYPVEHVVINYVDNDNILFLDTEFCDMTLCAEEHTIANHKFLESKNITNVNTLIWENIKSLELFQEPGGTYDSPLYLQLDDFSATTKSDDHNPFAALVMFPRNFAMALASVKCTLQQFFTQNKIQILHLSYDKLVKLLCTIYHEEQLLSLLFRDYKPTYFKINNVIRLTKETRAIFLRWEIYYRLRFLKGIPFAGCSTPFHYQMLRHKGHRHLKFTSSLLFSLENPFILCTFLITGLHSNARHLLL